MESIAIKGSKYSKLEVFNESFCGFDNFKPSSLLNIEESINKEKNASNSTQRVSSVKPFFSYLPRVNPDNFPKLSHLEAEILCKKKIKFINYYTITSSIFSIEKSEKYKYLEKLHRSLKNLKICKEFFIFNHSLDFKQKELLKIKQACKIFLKTMKGVHSEGCFDSLFQRSFARSLDIDSQSLKFDGATLKTLKLKRIFPSNMNNDFQILKKIKRLRKIEKIQIQIEDFRKIIKYQDFLSIIVEKLKTLKQFDLGLTFLVEREDLFDKGEKEEVINTKLLLWNKITGLHISDDDIPLDQIMEKVADFKALRKFSYYGEPKFRENFDSFKNLSKLPHLKKIDISISMLRVPGHNGAKFFKEEFLPPCIEELTLRMELQRLSATLEKVIATGTFFENMRKLSFLKYFLFSIGREGEDSDQKDYQILLKFFAKIVENLSSDLESLILVAFGFQRVLIKEENFSFEQDDLLNKICKNLQSLKSLFLKLPSINQTFDNISTNIFHRIEVLNIEGPLPLVLIKTLDFHNLKELYCQDTKKVDVEDFISFLKELIKFKFLRVLNIRLNSLFTKKYVQLSWLHLELFTSIVGLFRYLKLLNDLSLRITSLSVQKKVAIYLFELCHYKKQLNFCSIEFDNCEISKEYFSTYLTEGVFSSDEEST